MQELLRDDDPEFLKTRLSSIRRDIRGAVFSYARFQRHLGRSDREIMGETMWFADWLAKESDGGTRTRGSETRSGSEGKAQDA